MGFITKFIIRWGATGSTASWVGRHYMRLKDEELADQEVLRELIEFRYETYNLNSAKEELLKNLGEIDNLIDFTLAILIFEDAINESELTHGLSSEINEVIAEELKKKGLSEEEIGEGTPIELLSEFLQDYN